MNQLSIKTLLIFFAMSVGMFMVVLDAQIVISAISEISVSIGATPNDLSWIQTSYLIAEIIIVPISGFLVRSFSTRISYFTSIFGFTIASILCAFSWNIESMIIFRALQGIFGGAIFPIAFGTIFTVFPRNMHVQASTIMGIIITLAPTFGPIVGGYITAITSWHYIFLINVIPGIIVCIITLIYVDFDKSNLSFFKNFDFLGMIFVITGLGLLQYILEEGGKKDWFASDKIFYFSIISLTSFFLLLFIETRHKNPIINVRIFLNKNFSIGCFYSVILSAGLYSAVYLMPLFLSKVSNYQTIQIGQAMMITGIFQLITTPISHKIFENYKDKRLILAFGLMTFGFGCYLNSFLNINSAYWDFFVPQIFRGIGIMFCFVPINEIALSNISKNQMLSVSGLYSMMGTLGGAASLAIVNSYVFSVSEDKNVITITIANAFAGIGILFFISSIFTIYSYYKRSNVY